MFCMYELIDVFWNISGIYIKEKTVVTIQSLLLLSSPYVFVLAAAIMAVAIRENNNIKGINVYDKKQKISLYADDTTLYLAANEANLRAALDTPQ